MPELLTPNMLGFPAPRALDGVARKWEPDPSKYIGNVLLPEKNYPFTTVEWDELDPISGLTQAHNTASEPLTVAPRKRRKHSETSMFWKEKARIEEPDILNVRALGSFDKLAGESLVMDKMQQLMLRLDARIEQQRWGSMSGTLTVNENGIIRTISYTLLATPTASPTWDDPASDPIADIQAWAELMRGKTSGKPTIYYNYTVAKKLSNNEKVLDMVRGNNNVVRVGIGNVGNLIGELTGVANFVLYDEGYLAEGSPPTFTPFIPDNTLYMVGVPPMGQPLGHFYATPSTHNGGFNPRPGRFFFPKDGLNEGNPYYDLFGGIYGVPALRFPELILKATV
ncbi:MAG: major capsid protein [Vulcanimicrobiota bacterium]